MTNRKRGTFQSTPWTNTDIDVLFTENKEFRQVAIGAARRIGETSAGRTEGLKLARAAVGISRKVGEKLGRYPHPTLVLTWLREWPDKADRWMSPSRDDRDLVNAAMLNLLASGWRKPDAGLSGWDKLMHSISIAASSVPFFRKFQVHQFPVPGSGGFLGFPLRQMVVRVPIGASVSKEKDGKYTVTPKSMATRTIDFTSAAMVETFGQVWICVSRDRKSMFIASEKGSRSTKLGDLIGGGRGITGRDLSSQFETLYPGRGHKSALPPYLKNRLNAPAAERERGLSFVAN